MTSTHPGGRLGRLLHRECQTAIDALAATGDVHVRVHEARKAIRRARSLIALAAPEWGVVAADGTLQRAGEGLGSLRDAHASALTATGLAIRHPAGGWDEVAVALAARADRLVRHGLASDPGFARRRRSIRRAATQLQSLPWDTLRGSHLRQALSRQFNRVDKAARRARQDRSPQNQHRLRRRVRRLRMQLDALRRLGVRIPDLAPTRARQLHRLSDELGWQQDLEVLAQTLRRIRSLPARRERLALLADLRSPAAVPAGRLSL